MRTIEVKTKTPYTVKIGSGVLADCGTEFKRLGLDGRVLVVSDDLVAPPYLETIKTSLEKEGFNVFSFVISNGESSKNAENFVKLLNFAAENCFTRSDTFAALGGGVVGDLCGFAAASYMRGVNFVQLPTSLLAAVDSSVGGKTAIDLTSGKNLAGAFYQPRLVLCDTKTFHTLPKAEFCNGMAEVIKYGFICDRQLLDELKSDEFDVEKTIARCVEIKARIVENDELDTGERMLLNFGHTVGHAIEILSGFSVPHGQAVAIGMAKITEGCVKNGSCPKEAMTLLLELLKKYSLPHECEYNAAQICTSAHKDKKNSHGLITLVLPVETGKCVLKKCSSDELKELLR